MTHSNDTNDTNDINEAFEIGYAVGACTLGAVLVAATDDGICAILLGDERGELVRDLQRRFPQAPAAPEAGLGVMLAKVIALVEAPRTELDWPLDLRGTPFQRRVWQALRRIPAGSTVSYAELAAMAGVPNGARAVAGACAANALAVAIPCHRVLRSDGALSGYRWGVERKQALLAREGSRNSD